ncbi:COQ9 family protein [Puniceibacterium sp. IMCC21224]|uniref:COQ9 family protein n=1 Tax=Puniceibacterium sp. IMCC21224 TaxID=1618204 RepID=UPI00064DD6E0|nr:COQ9 family protein [Puniceibacterium sp. IMCC21224]KMK68409.1 rpsU-divergently transcribed protein [Puniceibacterium sp. IMCC21224]
MQDDSTLRLLEAALLHVPFDGWSEASFQAAIAESGVGPVLARALLPRGAVDLAMAYHRQGDAQMGERMAASDMDGMKYRDKVALAVRTRIQAAENREVVRRGTTLFALPPYAADGARLIWGTADAVWTALGDTSDDFNWYSKRVTLSGVYSATVLFWLGDDSPDASATWDFLDRRIDDVMRIEKVKASVRANPLLSRILAGPERVLARVRAPQARRDVPGGY